MPTITVDIEFDDSVSKESLEDVGMIICHAIKDAGHDGYKHCTYVID